jgi:hypothetical protein
VIFHYKEDFIEALARTSSSLSCVALDLFQASTMRSVIVFFALVTGASAFQARSPSARRSVTKVCKPPQRRGKQASLRVGGKRKAVLLAGDSPRTGGLLGWQRASWCRSESRSSSRRSRRRRRRNISSSSSSGSGGIRIQRLPPPCSVFQYGGLTRSFIVFVVAILSDGAAGLRGACGRRGRN